MIPISSVTIVRTVDVNTHALPLDEQPFIHAMFFLRDLMKKIIEQTQESTEISSTLLFNSKDLRFGTFLTELKQLNEEELLLPEIQKRREELCIQKTHWRPFIDQLPANLGSEILEKGTLIPCSAGAGGAYFLMDAQKEIRLIIKPVDEDVFCLNNRKQAGSVFNDHKHRVRDYIPLYRSAQTDAFCGEVALLSDLEKATPKVAMKIIQSTSFYDFTQWMHEEHRESFIAMTGIPDHEKLCSIQEYIPESQGLFELIHTFHAQNLTDEEISARFDQKDFEEVCLFLWLIYDNDAHGDNFRTYIKSIDETGRKIYGIKKIDNSLSFPEENAHYFNMLTWAPNAMAPLSKDLKQKIAKLPVDKILERMAVYEMQSCAHAFQERIRILQSLANREGITLGEIDLRLSFLSKENGKELAMSAMTTQEILEHFTGAQTTSTPQKEPL